MIGYATVAKNDLDRARDLLRSPAGEIWARG